MGILALHQGHGVAVDHGAREGAEDPEHEDEDAEQEQVLAAHRPRKSRGTVQVETEKYWVPFSLKEACV